MPPTQRIEMEAIQAAVNRAMRADSVAGARITTVLAHILSNPPTNAAPLTTATDQGPYLSAGAYTMMVYCAASGHVVAVLSVGRAATMRTVACNKLPEPVTLHLRARSSGEVTVQIATRGREMIAVAYQLAESGR